MDEPKRNRGFVPLLFSAVIGAIYLGFMVPYQLFTAPANLEDLAEQLMEKVGYSVDFSMVMPHLICFGAALFFNFLGAICLKRLLVLFSILLYIASIVLFYPYGPFAVAAIFFSLIGMFRIRRKKRSKKGAEAPAPAPTKAPEPAPAKPLESTAAPSPVSTPTAENTATVVQNVAAEPAQEPAPAPTPEAASADIPAATPAPEAASTNAPAATPVPAPTPETASADAPAATPMPETASADTPAATAVPSAEVEHANEHANE